MTVAFIKRPALEAIKPTHFLPVQEAGGPASRVNAAVLTAGIVTAATEAAVAATASKVTAEQVRQIVQTLLAEQAAAVPVVTPVMNISASTRTIVQGTVQSGSELAVVTLSSALPSGVAPVVVPDDGRLAVSPLRNGTTFSVLQGTSAISTGTSTFAIKLVAADGKQVGTQAVPFAVTVEAPVVTPTPAPTTGYSAVLTNDLGQSWTYTTDGKSSTQRNLAQRYTAEVPKSFAGVSSARIVLDTYATGWADFALRNDAAMILDGGPIKVSIKLYKGADLVATKAMDTIHQYTGRLYPIGTPVYPTLPTTASLETAGKIHRYIEGPVTESRLAAYAAQMTSPTWNKPGDSRGITQYMPATGGRADIGQTTDAQSAFLCSRDQRVFDYIVGQAEAGAVIPWHLWDKGNGQWLSTEFYPHLWSDGRGGTGTPGDRYASGLSQQIPSNQVTGWTPESAHMPDLFYIPYILTGREAFRDNLFGQASWSVMNVWAEDGRFNADPQRGSDGNLLVRGGQVRATAWVMKAIDNALATSDAGSFERTYFTKVSNRNWKWLRDQTSIWGSQQGETYGFIPQFLDDEGGLIRPWQEDYLTGTAAAAARRGNTDARAFLTWKANYQKGRVKFLGNDGPAYLIKIANASFVPYGTWSAVASAQVAAGVSNGSGWSHSDGDFAQLLIGALRLIWQVLGDTEARDLSDQLLAKNPPYTDSASYAVETLNRFERA